MRKRIVIVAGITILIILAASAFFHFGWAASRGGLEESSLWEAPLSGGAPETLKAIDLTGDGEDEIFVQTPGETAVFSQAGEQLFRQETPRAKTTMGDLNGDKVDEFVIALPQGGAILATAYSLAGGELWSADVPANGAPARAASIDFQGDSQREIILATELGEIIALNGQNGAELWRYTFPSDTPENLMVRASDDAFVDGKTYLVAADYGGHVVLLEGNGAAVWQTTFPEQLRRLRAADMDGDGTSELILGGLNGLVELASAADGIEHWYDRVGSRVQETRFIELDGDPATSEVVVGTRESGLAVFRLDGEKLWSKAIAGRVVELAGLDADGDGAQELLVAADKVSLLDGATGAQRGSFNLGEVSTLDVGDLGKEQAFVAGNTQGLAATQTSVQPLKWYSSPLVIGIILSLVIALAAVLLSRAQMAERPVIYSVVDDSAETLQAQKRMLREEIDELEKFHRSGQLATENYIESKRFARERLADVEARLQKVQPDYKPQVVHCPSCGGPLEISMERCEYCGHLLL
jgi:hypothetical protein